MAVQPGRWFAGFACVLLVASAIAASGIAASGRAAERTSGRDGGNETREYAAWIWLDERAAASDLPPAVGDEVLAARPAFDTDYPVNPDLVARITATGAHVRHVSRWLRAVAVDADSATLARLAAMPEVTRITAIRSGEAAGSGGSVAGGRPAPGERWTTMRPLDRSPARPLGFGGSAAEAQQQDSAHYGATWTPLRELNVPVLHSLEFRGNGIRIAIFDTGFFLNHESLISRRVVSQRDFMLNIPHAGPHPSDEPNQLRHGTAVWSLLGGFSPGRLVGGAHEASFYLAKVKRSAEDRAADEDRWVAAAEWADSMGVHIINSSIGFRDSFVDRPQIPYGDLDGNTTATTRAADEAARRGILVVVAIGNRGPQAGTLWAPADADSVISVGAIERLLLPQRTPVPAEISSRGPTADGRVKPELSANGTGITAASTVGTTAYETGFNGSSFATPFIAASAALFREAWPNLSIMAVRNALMLAGSNRLAPNNVVGFGVPDVAAAVMLPEGVVFGTQALSSLDLEGGLTTVLPTFRWETPLVHSRMRPLIFRVEVARDSAFQDIVYADTVRDANILTARQPLPRMDRAFWRVVTTSASTGVMRTSPTRPAFRVPAWVRLLTYNEPEPVFTDSIQPVLSWAPLAAPAPAGPFTYDVQVISVATGQVVQQVLGLRTSTVRVPEPLQPNQAYRWRVIVRAATGQSETVESLAPFVVQSTEAPPATILYRPFPNPFPQPSLPGGGMAVWFDLHESGPVELNVYDLRGRLIRRLIPARPDCGAIDLVPGLYGRGAGVIATQVDPACALTRWDGRDENGREVSAGVYVIRLRAAGVIDVQRVLYQPQRF